MDGIGIQPKLNLPYLSTKTKNYKDINCTLCLLTIIKCFFFKITASNKDKDRLSTKCNREIFSKRSINGRLTLSWIIIKGP